MVNEKQFHILDIWSNCVKVDIRDKTNNNLDNLKIKLKSLHRKLDAKRLVPETFICPVCNNTFTLEGNKLRNHHRSREQGKSGPYCDKRCAGIDSHNQIRNSTVTEKTYYKLDKIP